MCVGVAHSDLLPNTPDDDEISAVTPAEGDTFLASRPSLSEQNDTVAPLPDDEEELVVRRKHTFAQAISDADSAIGMVSVGNHNWRWVRVALLPLSL